jgi:hypothetical protein
MAAVEEKSIVPTILVGVGGTGVEVLSRVRRLVEESYGSLKNFPLISFLSIDTDKDYKVSNPEAAGSPLQDHEKYWASVSGEDVSYMIDNMPKYPWIESWFPKELERNIKVIEKGAKQIRSCGRFAFFCNYHKIKARFKEACDRVKGHETFMLDKYDIRVVTNALNVFIVGSLSGGTGSGMLIDIGYCIRNWLEGQGGPLITAIVPMPNAFANIQVGERVLANGYAALMELSYFSDYRTEYVAQFSSGLVDEVRDKRPPFDFTYVVGTKNDEAEFRLPQIREMIAQNIFLDLTSDFAPHKRSIRNNIEGAWAQADPEGRGYPKNFMSFGLATIEIPVAQIRATLANRLAVDLVGWWLNESVPLPPNMVVELLQTDILKRMRLTEAELLADLSSGNEKSLISEVSNWVNSIRNEIATDNKLQCTYQGANLLLGREKGKILQFVDYLKPKVEEYRAHHLRELSPDERAHGDFLQKMYDNRNRIIQQGRNVLEAELYSIIRDRNRGPKFADAFIANVRQLLTNSSEKFRRESEKTWQPNEINRQHQYEGALQEINQFKNSFGLTKQSQMEKHCEDALTGIEASAVALIQRKARALGLEVIARLQEHLERLEQRLARFNQKLRQLRDDFQQAADKETKSADTLQINGVKLYDRKELNLLYQDVIDYLAGVAIGSHSRYELGLNQVCITMTEDILQNASPLWKEKRQADEVMQLLDITQLPENNYENFKEKIAERTRLVVQQAPEESRLKRELAACDRLLKDYQNDPEAIRSKIRLVYQKSHPLILLSQGLLLGAGFTPALNIKVAIVGGSNTSDPAAKKLLPFLQERVGSADALTPLGEQERHQIVFVQEIGGFSLRCIDGMSKLQESYQDWKGQIIEAKRAKLRGESRDLPIPVHIQKEAPFWDVFPEDPEVFRLVLQARALGVLKLEENRSTQEKVIRYTHKTVTGSENMDIAATWEEVVQVLEVRACRPDKEEIQKQVSAKFLAADQPQSKQALYDQLMTYLKQREADLEKLGGADSPDYKREATIIQDVIKSYKLKVSEDNEPLVTPKLQPVIQPHPVERHIGFEINSSDSSSQAKYEKYQQYLTQLWNLNVPQEAFVTTAKAKASELKLDLQKAETIWNKFINPPLLSFQEAEYEQYISKLSSLNVPTDAFINSAEAKALELGLDRSKAEAIWNKFI